MSLESDEFDEYNYSSQELCHSCLLVFKTQILKLWLRKLYGTRSLGGGGVIKNLAINSKLDNSEAAGVCTYCIM